MSAQGSSASTGVSLAEELTYKLCSMDTGRPKPDRPTWFDRETGESVRTWETRAILLGTRCGFYVKDPVASASKGLSVDMTQEPEHPYMESDEVISRLTEVFQPSDVNAEEARAEVQKGMEDASQAAQNSTIIADWKDQLQKMA
ncbi:hypothetical protein IAT38_008439 [Cryptococcus sp. DSM 104549]